jgi:hypothetical protein
MGKDLIFLHTTGYGDSKQIKSPAGINHIVSFLAEHSREEFKLMSMTDLGFNSDGNSFFGYIRGIYRMFYMLKDSRSVIIYHSLTFVPFIFIFLLFKRKLVLQFNEVYTDYSDSKWKKTVEVIYVRLFSKYILANASLINFIPDRARHVTRGGYLDINHLRDNQILVKNHFVYAGRIDERKMGNLKISMELIRTKPPEIDLTMHVFGPDAEELRSFASSYGSVKVFVNSNESEIGATFSRVSFGLVLQSSSKSFNSTSFPSKIYKYISYGITPICVETSVIKNSEIVEYLGCIENWNWSEILSMESVVFTHNKLNQLKNIRWGQIKDLLN